jgi:hypothetical protein
MSRSDLNGAWHRGLARTTVFSYISLALFLPSLSLEFSYNGTTLQPRLLVPGRHIILSSTLPLQVAAPVCLLLEETESARLPAINR